MEQKNSINNLIKGFISSVVPLPHAGRVTDGSIVARCRVTLVIVDKVLTLYIYHTAKSDTPENLKVEGGITRQDFPVAQEDM